MELTIKVSKSRIKVKDIIEIEEGNLKTRKIVEVIANMLWNEETGEYYPQEEAFAILTELNIETLDKLGYQIVDQLKAMRKEVLPLPKNSNS